MRESYQFYAYYNIGRNTIMYFHIPQRETMRREHGRGVGEGVEKRLWRIMRDIMVFPKASLGRYFKVFTHGLISLNDFA